MKRGSINIFKVSNCTYRDRGIYGHDPVSLNRRKEPQT